MSDVWSAGTAFLRALPPELAHRISILALRCRVAPRQIAPDDPILAQRLWNRDIANPIGLAAGYDKGAQAPRAALALGFGLVEIGTVTPEPQPGNPRPRIFRLHEDRALINRLGFNSEGAGVVGARLARLRAAGGKFRGPIGVNLGKNKDSPDAAADYARGARALGQHADYVVINVSSPNTPGLRELQRRAALGDLVGQVRAAMAPARAPLLVKVAPDLSASEREDIASVVLDGRVDGLIIGNSTLSRPTDLVSAYRGEVGGLSGRPLFALSTAVLGDFHRLTQGRIPLIGCGGVASGRDAYAKIRAGASLVQLYTALVYEGPGLIGRIKAELAALLRRDGFASVAGAVGAARPPPPAGRAN